MMDYDNWQQRASAKRVRLIAVYYFAISCCGLSAFLATEQVYLFRWLGFGSGLHALHNLIEYHND